MNPARRREIFERFRAANPKPTTELLYDTPFELRWGGKVFDTVRARDLWNLIIENAHASAEPGIIFWDTMREYHNVEFANPLESTNPCGEQPLAPYTACNLGSINLSRFVLPDGVFDYQELAEVSRTATRFLDDVIDYNMDAHALEKIKIAVASDRRIGLGITGLADALARMGVKYDTDEALVVVDRMMETICRAAYQTSIDLARENVTVQEEGLRIAQARFDNGATSELDVTQARTLLESTRATIPQLEASLQQAENALATLLGQTTGALGQLLEGPAAIPAVPPQVSISVPAEMLRRRADIRAAELTAMAQADRIGIRTHGSVVTLDGIVTTEQERKRAELDAWCLFAVDKVINHIEVRP